LYKGTKVEQAIEDKFATGGVIGGTSAGMAILSKVFFSAENGAFYPADGLENINSPYFSLKNDFVDIFPEFIFDTHFVERGRNTRLIAFMAKWFQQTGNLIKGIGVDDQTALCINAAKQATCYGTGAVHIYDATSSGFSFFNNKMSSEVTAKILVHNHQIDLTNLNVLQGGSESFNPLINQEDGNYTVFLSGGEGITDNNTFIKDFVLTSNPTHEIIIVTGTDTTIAAQYKQQMKVEGANKITILQAITANNQDDKYTLRNAIKQSKKVFFVNIVSYSLFSQFLSGQTGLLLNKHIRRNEMLNAFVGDNCKLAGKTYVTNNRSSQYNAYDGNLTFTNGLGLLKTTTVLPNAFNPDDNNFYENNSCAVSYAIAQNKLKFGIYINKKSWIKYTQNANQNIWSAGGQYVSTVLHNTGTQGAFTTQIASSSSNKSRNIAGFSQVKYTMLNNNTLQAGVPIVTNDEAYQLESPPMPTGIKENNKGFRIFPNPTKDFLEVVWENEDFNILIYDAMGVLLQNTEASHQTRMNLQTLKKGVYTIRLISKKTQNIINRQIVIL
jgi:cyanophycinase-like exopeptidase